MMWDHPDDPNANTEAYKYQFFLGKDFLVAPVYRSQVASKGWRKGIYLPQGQWIDYWDGRVLDVDAKGKVIDYQVTLDKLPVLVRAGAILPMYPTSLYDGQVPKDVLTLDIYPHGKSEFTLYEDDGESRDYQTGQHSLQRFAVDAPIGKAGEIKIVIDGVIGSYQGMETQRVYQLQVHSRVKPDAVFLQAQLMTQLSTQAQFEQAKSGWFYDAEKTFGLLYIKTEKVAVAAAYQVRVVVDADAKLATTSDFPSAPQLGNALAADSLIVLNRSAEEPGHPFENALDGKPDTWFRTVRDQSQKTGAHEFTLALGERRMINGFEIAPRNDKNWKYGQAKDVEVYLGDANGEWGAPVFSGRLKQLEGKQKVEFKAKAGRLLRMRILSTHDESEDGVAQDAMVTASSSNIPVAKAYNSLTPIAVGPISISEFSVLEYQTPDRPKQQIYLSDMQAAHSHNGNGKVSKDHANTAKASLPGNSENLMQMNGLKFHKGLGVSGLSEIEYHLTGDWHTFRADVGIDDACRKAGGLQFQLLGDGKLLFDSGLIEAPAVVKPELDIRGIEKLILKTTGLKKTNVGAICANWANATLIGFQGDTVGK
jgi:hypothetical protein